MTAELILRALTLSTLAQTPITPEALAQRIDRDYPAIQGARAQIDAAKARLKERRGAFDPVFTIDTSQLRYNSSSNRGKAYATEMTEGTVEVLTPGGLKLFVGSRLNLGDVKSPRSSTGSLGEYFVGVKVPLLRGNGLNPQSVAESQARLGISVAEQDLSLIRISALQDGLAAYWKWAAAGQRRQVAAQLLGLARTRAVQIRKRVEAEDLPRIELTEAETEVLRREGDLAKAERGLEGARLQLSLFLWEADGPASDWNSSAIPDLGVPTSLDADTIRTAEAEAVQRRPELEGLDLSRRSVQLSLDLARNNRRPALDFVVSPGVDLGSDSVGSTMKAGLFYSVPLRQNTADGRIEEARQRLRKIGIDREFVEQRIRTEVRDAASAIEAAFARYQAAQAEVELAERLQRGEQIRYEAGEGTLFLLIQRERATAEARARLIDVLADYQIARLALRAAMADL
ncbi:MAG: TolC family protein [Fimbriimonas sp.]